MASTSSTLLFPSIFSYNPHRNLQPPKSTVVLPKAKTLTHFLNSQPCDFPLFQTPCNRSLNDMLLPSQNEEENRVFAGLHQLLRKSIRYGDIPLGRAIHAVIVKDYSDDTHLTNVLISMYVNFGFMIDACKVFNEMLSPDLVSYTTLISGYSKLNKKYEAIQYFFQMRLLGIEPNGFSFVAMLSVCALLGDPKFGFQIHALTIKTEYAAFIYVINALMAFYEKIGHHVDAYKLFDQTPVRDLITWNTIMSVLVHDSQYKNALEILRSMQNDGFRPDQYSVSTALTAAAYDGAFLEGVEIHAYALRNGFDLNTSVGNSLMQFYTECGSVEQVMGVFASIPMKDVISWTLMVRGCMEFGMVEYAIKVFNEMPEKNGISYNTLLSGLVQNGHGKAALDFFTKMLEHRIELSDFSLLSVTNAGAMIGDVKTNEQIHGFITKVGICQKEWIETTLVNMFAKCGRMAHAQKIFDTSENSRKDMYNWTSLICGYAQNELPELALSLFLEMKHKEDVTVDEVTLTTILSVCGSLGLHMKGKQIHGHILKSGFLSDTSVANAIFSMYAKSGEMRDAITFFELMPMKDIVTWNALINFHVLHGEPEHALDAWRKAEELSIKPDRITFLSLLHACRHTKQKSIDTCNNLVLSMENHYGIKPDSAHYAAMVEVLGYWGHFKEIEELIKEMPFQPDRSIWISLLDVCSLHSNVKLGRQAAQNLLALQPKDPSTYILVSNLYAASGRWNCSEKVREEMRKKGFQKSPVRSWIVHQNTVHSFFTRDRLHSQSKDIYSALDILILECMKFGYEPDTSFVLHEVEEYQRKEFLYYHSAKLAVTYGILVNEPGKPVRVMKNIRLCGDCHAFFKLVSKVTGRVIYLRDTSLFHCFKFGRCSCEDC